jgi:cell division ATPase FtsA
MKKTGSLVFYIGNSIVKGSIVCHEKDKVPMIMSSRIKEVPRYHERDRAHLESRILEQFKELVDEVKKNDFKVAVDNGIKIHNTCVVISSPWYLSETKLIKIEENKPFLVTQSLVDNLCSNVSKGYKGSNSLNIDILEQKIIKTSLNGYQTLDPLKKMAKTLEINLFTSFVRKSSVDSIKSIIERQFHTNKIDIHSQSLASFSIISGIWKHDADKYIIADITSELTELVIVRNGIISESASFPKGKGFIEEAISEKLNVTLEVAESMLKMYSRGEIDTSLKSKIDSVLEKTKVDWMRDLTDSLSTMSVSATLPSTFYVFTSNHLGKIFCDYISSEEYQQFSFSDGAFDVHEVRSTDFTKLYSLYKDVQSDTSLIIGALFNNHYIHDRIG